MPAEDLTLLIRTHRGHEPSARMLWARFSPGMIAYAAGILRDPDAAADVVQSVFLSILRLPARRIRQVRDCSAWLMRLTRSAALNHFRTIRRERARIGQTAPGTAHPMPQRIETTKLERELGLLSRRDREIIILKHVAGLTFDQIALSLSLNRNTAAARYRAAMARFRERVEPSSQATVGELCS